MNNILTIMSKEFARFFGDRRMVIMTIMPAILIYVIYSFMGSTLSSVFAPDEGHEPQIFAVSAPDSISRVALSANLTITHIEAVEADAIREKIKNKDDNADVLMVFPLNFDDLVEGYDAQTSTTSAPNIEIYFNSTVPNSQQTFSIIQALLDAYESSLANKFDINRDIENADLATVEDMTATIVSTMMPMLLMLFLFSGCMGISLESITGEKERGTLATLLVSPLKRSELAIGKILSLSVLSLLSGITTTIATIMSLPNLMGGTELIDTGIYSTTDYLLLALVILSVLLLMVSLMSIISAFSKTVKEAGQAATPLMIVVMVVGVSGMFGNAPTDAVYYLIPFYNSVQSMSGIFSREYSTINIAIACGSSLLYAAIGGFVLTKLFNSEKVMFSR